MRISAGRVDGKVRPRAPSDQVAGPADSSVTVAASATTRPRRVLLRLRDEPRHRSPDLSIVTWPRSAPSCSACGAHGVRAPHRCRSCWGFPRCRRLAVSGASAPLSRWLDILVGDGAVGSGSALQVIARSGPFPGEEVVEAGIWPEIDETAENVGKVPIRIDVGELAGLCRPPNYAERACFPQDSR